MPADLQTGCPICRASAQGLWIEEKQNYLFECEACSIFTITNERQQAFEKAWRCDDREVLMYLEALSRYLRLAGDDDDREVTADSWMSLAAEGDDLN